MLRDKLTDRTVQQRRIGQREGKGTKIEVSTYSTPDSTYHRSGVEVAGGRQRLFRKGMLDGVAGFALIAISS